MDIRGLKAEYLPRLKPVSDSPELDCDLIIALALKQDVVFLYSHTEYQLKLGEVRLSRRLFEKRLKGYPIAYLRGFQPFMDYTFFLNRHTLVPRPETELIVEEIAKMTKDHSLILDIGTGSGAIVVSLAKLIEADNCIFAGTDISLGALRQAKINAKYNKAAGISFYWRDLIRFFPWKKYHRSKHLVIAANLPYVSAEIYRNSRSIQKEPQRALLSSEAGLKHYRRLIGQIKHIPAHFQTVTVFCEISPEQADTFPVLPGLAGKKITIIKDLSGKDRIARLDWR